MDVAGIRQCSWCVRLFHRALAAHFAVTAVGFSKPAVSDRTLSLPCGWGRPQRAAGKLPRWNVTQSGVESVEMLLLPFTWISGHGMSFYIVKIWYKHQFVAAETVTFPCRASSDSRRQWSLVMQFCKLHGIRPSTSYLKECAQSNDWLQFVVQAQLHGYQQDEVSWLWAGCSRNGLCGVKKNTKRTSHFGDNIKLKARRFPQIQKLSQEVDILRLQ